MELVFCDINVSFATPAVVDLSVCIGVRGWGQPISINVWRIGTSSFDVMKSAPRSALADEDMTNLMTWTMINMGQFQLGTGSFFCDEDVGYSSTTALGFIVESCIGVCSNHHTAGSVDYYIVRVSDQVVQEVVDGLIGALSGCRLLITYGI